MAHPRLLIVEDRVRASQGIGGLLSRDFEIVATVSPGALVGRAVTMHRPDTVLLDLSHPGGHGIHTLQELKETHPQLPVVTLHASRATMDMAMRFGAEGLVPEDAEIEELRTAIEDVLAGRRYLSPIFRRGDAEAEVESAGGFERLTPRQREIVLHISQDLTSRQIAERMGLSLWTVHFHRKNTLKRLGLRTDKELYRYAILAASKLNKGKPE